MGDTHSELVSVSAFNRKFKDTLRDYYTYGFKEKKEYGKSSTFSEDWTRITNILDGYYEWEKGSSRGGGARFWSLDSRQIESNPFHKIYQFCRHKVSDADNPDDLEILTDVILALSSQIEINESYLDYIQELQKTKFGQEYANSRLSNLGWDISENRGLETSDLYALIYPNEELYGGNSKQDVLGARLKRYEALGLLVNVNSSSTLNNKWKLQNPTVERLIKEGNKLNSDFERNFLNAITFFSRYYPLGEVGASIKQRITLKKDNVFRFQYDYCAQALNDYNLIDLLLAISKSKLCQIGYTNPYKGVNTNLICYILEIRMSVTDGRQYVAYYEPEMRNVSFLRLEFIDSIRYIDDEKICKKYEALYVNDFDHIEYLCKHVWGASTGNKSESNVVDKPYARHISLTLNVMEKETYIIERMEREGRCGSIKRVSPSLVKYDIDVIDPQEMIPWIRSFGERVVKVEGIEWRTGKGENVELQKKLDIWKSPEYIDNRMTRKGNKMLHEQLFHEANGIYFAVYAEVVLRLMVLAQNKTVLEITMVDVNKVIEEVVNSYRDHLGNFSKETQFAFRIKKYLECGRFIFQNEKDKMNRFSADKYRLKYFCVNDSLKNIGKDCSIFLRYIKPLLDIECEWLKAMLEDPLCCCFLTKDEMAVVSRMLSDEIIIPESREKYDKLCVDDKHFIDVYCKNDKKVKILTEAIRNKGKISFQYKVNEGNAEVVENYPCYLMLQKYTGHIEVVFENGLRCNIASMKYVKTINVYKQPAETESKLPDRSNVIDFSVFRFYDVNMKIVCQEEVAKKIWIINDAIERNRKLEVTWITNQEQKIDRIVQPIHIEFSKRKGLFYLVSYYDEGKWIDVIRLDKLLQLKCINKYWEEDSQKIYSEYIEYKKRNLELIVENRNNALERILTEFSPWEKRCFRLSCSDKYCIRIKYLDDDAYEIAMRVVKYLPYVEIGKDNKTILRLIEQGISATEKNREP